MKSYLIRLDREDQRIRKELMRKYERLHGRPIPFADIVRVLLREKHHAMVHCTDPSQIPGGKPLDIDLS